MGKTIPVNGTRAALQFLVAEFAVARHLLRKFSMNRSPQQKPRTRAFTLIEVMLGGAFIALAFIGMVQVIISGSNMLDLSRKQTIAAQIIHTELDQVKLYDWTTVNGWASTSSTISIDTLSGSDAVSSSRFGYPELQTLKNVAKGFTVVRTVTAISGRADMVTIKFTVTWTSNLSTKKTFSRYGTTNFGKNGLFVTYKRA